MKRPVNDRVISWLFLVPTFITLGITAFVPLLYSIWLSFYRVKLNLPNLRPNFVGLANYQRMIGDLLFNQSVINTIIFALASVFLEILLGLVIAMLVSSDDRWAKWVRSLFLVPMIMAPVASGTLWRMMLDRTTGVVNYLLGFIGVHPISWLNDPLMAMTSIILVDVWRLTPWVTIILVSALKAVSVSWIEAALVDGASPWKIFTKIIFPMLKPVLIIVIMIRFIDAFKVFDTVYVMTGGGPGMATEMLPNFIYHQGLMYFDAGYAAALAWVFILAMAIASYYFVKLRVKQEQELK